MNSPAPKTTWEGRTVGKFRLGQLLGSSDHSSVFLTELTPGGKSAAIKLVPADKFDVTGQIALWNSARELSHPHLLKILEAGTCEFDGGSFLYVVIEATDDELSQVLPQRALTPEEAKEFVSPVLDALVYLHEKGFVHGAVKPTNIQAAENQIKLSCDRLQQIGAKARRTLPATAYDAPESTAGTLTPASDVWSLGVSLVESLTQRLPKIEAGNVVVPETIAEPFRGIAKACLQADPARRCDLREIQSRLAGRGASPAVRQSPPPPPVPQPEVSEAPRSRSNRLLISIIAVCAILAALGYALFRHGKPETSELPASSPPQSSVPSPPTPAMPAAQSPTPAQATRSNGQVLHQVLPDVPRSARNTIHGRIKVSVRVDVDSEGKVKAATVTSAGPSQYFANLAHRAAQRWEFSPPMVDGKATPSTWNIRFQFSRGSTQAFPSKAR